MPKEVIYTSELPYDEQDPAVGIIEISWSREAGHVQIASKIVHRADHSEYVHPTFLEYLKPLDEPQRQLIESMMCGKYSQLDRDSINSIIRVLRRARDQAFGRDE